MTTFRYQAVNETGRIVAGTIEAQSADHANDLLAARRLSPVDMRAESTTSSASGSAWERFARRFNTVHPEELILFTKQLSTMLKAGIPVLRVMEILEEQNESERLKEICRTVAHDIRSGSNLHHAMSKHPDVFDPLYCSMVQAGEASGALPQILQRLIYIISHEYKVKSDIRSVMQYPIIVLVALTSAFVGLITFVIPKFAAVYAKAQITLPFPTRVCMALSTLFNEYWHLVLLALALVIGGFVFALRTTGGRYVWDRFKLQVPMIGPVMQKAALSRFASIFSILQASGVGIMDSVKILAGAIGNAAIARELATMEKNLEQGRGVARPLMQSKFFTPMFVNMVAIGEEAGNLDEMLKEVSNHYDSEVEFATRRLTTAMGPILMVGLAAMVGFFALAVYMPMWDLAKMAGKG